MATDDYKSKEEITRRKRDHDRREERKKGRGREKDNKGMKYNEVK